MSSSAPASTLVALCAEQHRVILRLLTRLSQAADLDLGQRRTYAQKLRQRLSRHIQLERHAFYPLLRPALKGAPHLSIQLDQLDQSEQRLRDLLPDLTRFLHQAERAPQQLDAAAALYFRRQLQAQFEQEEQVLHPLFADHVSPEAEQQQLRLFHKRLQATVAPQASARNRRPSLEELERQAVTRPVLPNERLWNTVQLVSS
ncbi:MAG: hemerythrin domain-containing protein [Thermostichus sp. HHBFW_bins_43]